MLNYREILRFQSLGYSQRQIGRTGVASRDKIRDVLAAADHLGISWPLDESVTNEELKQLLFPNQGTRIAKAYAEPDYAYIHKELAKPGVKMSLLWEEYCKECLANGQAPYMSTQFGDKYRKWARVLLDSPASLPRILGDEGRLVQILDIFLDNALSFTPEGGKIRLSAREHRGKVLLAVEDSGPGVPEEHKARIFERFYRVEAARSDNEHFGLGLSIAAEIAAAAHADIKVQDSTLGGARFLLFLPTEKHPMKKE